MNNFAKLHELQDSIKPKTKKGKVSKADYVDSLNEVFNMNCTIKDVHKSFNS